MASANPAGDGVNNALMSKVHKSVLTTLRSDLVDNILPDELQNSLVSLGAITLKDLERIKGKNGRMEKTEEILDTIFRKPDRCFNLLIEGLNRSDQPHIAEFLKQSEQQLSQAQAAGITPNQGTDFVALEQRDGDMDRFLMENVVPRLGSEYLKIGIALGVSYDRINAYRIQFHYDTEQLVFSVLKEWARRGQSANDLADALEGAGRKDLSYTIRSALQDDKWKLIRGKTKEAEVASPELLMDQFIVKHVVPKLGMDAMRVCLTLGIGYERITALKAQGQSAENQHIAMLKEWTMRHDYSISQLLDALEHCQRRDVCVYVRKIIQQSPWNKLP